MNPSQAAANPRPASVRRITTRFRPTVEGMIWFAIAALLLYQGWLRTINLIALLASILIALWILNAAVVWSYHRLRQVTVRRRVHQELFAGQPFVYELEIDNPTRHSFRNLTVICRDLTVPTQGFVSVLKPRSTARAFGEGIIPRRGRHRWGPVEISSGFPFGLFRRRVEIDDGFETVVLPRLGHLDLQRFRRLLLGRTEYDARHQPMIRQPGSQTEFHGLREFRSGDSPRWIHWRTTARVGELMIREYEEPPASDLVLVLDPWLPDRPEKLRKQLDEVIATNQATIRRLLASGPPPSADKRKAKEASLARKELPYRVPLENLETAISLAATLCWEWNRLAGARIRVIVGDGQSPQSIHSDGTSQGLLRLLERLALVEGGPEADAGAGFWANLLKSPPLSSAPVLVLTTRTEATFGDGPWSSANRRLVMIRIAQGEHAEFFNPGSVSAGVSVNGSVAFAPGQTAAEAPGLSSNHPKVPG